MSAWPHPYTGHTQDDIPGHLEFDLEERYVLVEYGLYDEINVTSSNDKDALAVAWSCQEYAEEWEPRLLWDQQTGVEYRGEVTLTVKWVKERT